MSSSGKSHDAAVDPVQRQAHFHAAAVGGAKGGALGLAGGIPTAFLLNRNWAPFRTLTLPLKAFFVTAITLSSGVIAADKAALAFERGSYSDQGAKMAKRNMSREERQWAELSTGDKILTWTKENKFSLVAGTFVTGITGTFAYIQYQPLSFAQKLVQARVAAQSLTLASLLGMAAISSIPSAGDKILEEQHHASDHSWKDMIGELDDQDQDQQQKQKQQPKQQQKQKQQKPSQHSKETSQES